MDIDFVITWVDGSDENWLAEKARYSVGGEEDARPERYRDWNLLQYWFRGVDKYAPWVRKIHFVTWGHLPKWLNTNHPKLNIVKHSDYIPEEYLPIFNSSALEINFHRIKGLSENFVYFNDDVHIINKVNQNDFFVDNKPVDMLALQPVVANPANPVMSHIYLNNALIISKYFDKRKNMRSQPGKYFKPGYPPMYFFYNMLELAFPLFTGFFTSHGASPLKKSTIETLWRLEEQAFEQTSKNRFRSKDDITQYLFREWQKLSGDFHAKNILKDFRYFNVDSDNPKLCSTIEKQKVKMICINDANKGIDFEKASTQLHNSFDKILPEKCSYENAD